jgi:hypothetical protein
MKAEAIPVDRCLSKSRKNRLQDAEAIELLTFKGDKKLESPPRAVRFGKAGLLA